MANPPIIIKKVSGHAGHHGGAWKVAYADFVTAMMSLFIVLWLLNSSKQVKEAVGGYFKDPAGSSRMVGSNMQGAGNNLELRKDDMKKIKDALLTAIKALPDFDKIKKNIDLTITSEGLRVELREDEGGMFFEVGSAVPSSSGKELLIALAQEVGKLPNKVSIEGHTDPKPYSGRVTGYSNWELSVDRANAARRIVQNSGIRQEQVAQVRGFADQQPRVNHDPNDSANRRISFIVQYITPPADPAEDDAKGGETAKAKAGDKAGGEKGSGEKAEAAGHENKH